MENFGCIIYRETRLFYNNRTSTSSNKQGVALVIAHEVCLKKYSILFYFIVF